MKPETEGVPLFEKEYDGKIIEYNCKIGRVN
jgi:hypothetical protein